MMKYLLVPGEEKVLPDRYPAHEERAGRMAKDETFAFQLAFLGGDDRKLYTVSTESEISDLITCRKTDLVPCTYPRFGNFDEWYISDKPFLCPDLLTPLDGSFTPQTRKGWNSLRFTVRGKLRAGVYPIRILLTDKTSGETLVDTTYTLTVEDFTLGESRLIYTAWFHYDGIAQYYHLPVFGKEYNRIVDNFVRTAVRHGMNMLLIPMFTPPLDTAVGAERLTVQLVDVTETEDSYEVSLDRLIAFMKRVQKLGVRYFEMSHLFSQWGATATPKVIAKTADGERRIFGWDTPSATGEYPKFLSVFLPALRERLIAEGLYDRCRFHISDEPGESHIENYRALSKMVKTYMPDAVIMDALSHYEFYEQGLVDRPVVATNAMTPFLANRVPNLWAYYCCGQGFDYLSNRLMSMHGERTRVLGFQLWLCRAVGFLQWGYNFYNSWQSERPIDPYLVNDGDGAWPSGDPFVVYPSQNGEALDSIRHEIFYDAIQDYNLMCRAEEAVGREAAEKLLTDLGFTATFTDYPHDLGALKEARRRAQDAVLQAKRSTAPKKKATAQKGALA